MLSWEYFPKISELNFESHQKERWDFFVAAYRLPVLHSIKEPVLIKSNNLVSAIKILQQLSSHVCRSH
jgi:hypothetical protein